MTHWLKKTADYSELPWRADTVSVLESRGITQFGCNMECIWNPITALHSIIESKRVAVGHAVVNQTYTDKRNDVPSADTVAYMQGRHDILQQIRVPMTVILRLKFTAFSFESMERYAVTDCRSMPFPDAKLQRRFDTIEQVFAPDRWADKSRGATWHIEKPVVSPRGYNRSFDICRKTGAEVLSESWDFPRHPTGLFSQYRHGMESYQCDWWRWIE